MHKVRSVYPCWRKHSRCSYTCNSSGVISWVFTTAYVAAAPRLIGEVRVTQASTAVPRLLASPMEDVHDGAYRVEYSKNSFDPSCAEMGASSLIGYTAADSQGNDEQPYQPCLGLSILVGTVQLSVHPGNEQPSR